MDTESSSVWRSKNNGMLGKDGMTKVETLPSFRATTRNPQKVIKWNKVIFISWQTNRKEYSISV